MTKTKMRKHAILNLKRFGQSLLDIVYPRFCSLCAVKIYDPCYEGICQLCFSQIKTNVSPFCKKCGMPLSAASLKAMCSYCQAQNYHFDQALSVCTYNQILKTCIQLFKYKRKLKIGFNLAKIMVSFLRKHLDFAKLDVIIPVPLHRSKLRERGFNQAKIFSDALYSGLDLPCSFNNLRRVKKTCSQFALDPEQRRNNVKDAFRCQNASGLKNKSILLVDDIFTTGATLNECALVLKKSGALKVTTLTMAR